MARYIYPDRVETGGFTVRILTVRWSPSAGQFGGCAKLGSGSGQAANLFVSFSVPIEV
jgi:hypothetical protein